MSVSRGADMPAACKRGLDQAGAIQPRHRLAAPDIGHAEKAFGHGDKIGWRIPEAAPDGDRRHSRHRSGKNRRTPAPAAAPRSSAARRWTAALICGPGQERRRQAPAPGGSLRHAGTATGHAHSRHNHREAIWPQAQPCLLLIDGEKLRRTKVRSAVRHGNRARRACGLWPAQRHEFFAFDKAFGFHLAFQMRGGEIGRAPGLCVYRP